MIGEFHRILIKMQSQVRNLTNKSMADSTLRNLYVLTAKPLLVLVMEVSTDVGRQLTEEQLRVVDDGFAGFGLLICREEGQ